MGIMLDDFTLEEGFKDYKEPLTPLIYDGTRAIDMLLESAVDNVSALLSGLKIPLDDSFGLFFIHEAQDRVHALEVAIKRLGAEIEERLRS